VAAPDHVDVWIGLHVGKDDHFVDVVNDDGDWLFGRAVVKDQAAIEALIDRAGEHGSPALVIDQPGSIAQSRLLSLPNVACRWPTSRDR